MYRFKGNMCLETLLQNTLHLDICSVCPVGLNTCITPLWYLKKKRTSRRIPENKDDCQEKKFFCMRTARTGRAKSNFHLSAITSALPKLPFLFMEDCLFLYS